MQTIDFLERLKQYTEQLIFTPSIIQVGMYRTDGNSVAIRVSPTRYEVFQ